MTRSTFHNNRSTYHGGALDNFNNGILTVTNSTFVGNVTPNDGGAIYCNGTANVSNSTITGKFGGLRRRHL